MKGEQVSALLVRWISRGAEQTLKKEKLLKGEWGGLTEHLW